MKYKRLFVVLLLIFTWYAHSQVDDLNVKAKYILDSNQLVAEENGSWHLYFLYSRFDSDEQRMKTILKRSEEGFATIDELLTYYKKSKEDLMLLSELTEKKSSAIIADLKQKQFLSKSNVKINVIDEEHVLIRVFTLNEQGNLTLSNSYFLNLQPITINSRYTVFRLGRNKLSFTFGYLVPLKDKYIFKYENDLVENQNRTEEDNAEIRNTIAMQYEAGKVYTENKKYGFKSESGNLVLLKPVYDSIGFCGTFIVAKKEKLFQVFLKNGELVNVPGLRGISSSNNGYGALINNEIHWMDDGGKILEKLPPKSFMDFCGTVPQISRSIVKEKDSFKYYYFSGGMGYGNQGQEKILCPSNSLKNITFLNQQTKIESDSNNDYSIQIMLSPNSFIIETLDNNASIAKFNNGEIEYILKPDKYTFTYISNFLVKYELDGMYGIYPFQKRPSYKKISDFEKGFARFEMPNGKKGWLDVKGNEFLDI